MHDVIHPKQLQMVACQDRLLQVSLFSVYVTKTALAPADSYNNTVPSVSLPMQFFQSGCTPVDGMIFWQDFCISLPQMAMALIDGQLDDLVALP